MDDHYCDYCEDDTRGKGIDKAMEGLLKFAPFCDDEVQMIRDMLNTASDLPRQRLPPDVKITLREFTAEEAKEVQNMAFN